MILFTILLTFVKILISQHYTTLYHTTLHNIRRNQYVSMMKKEHGWESNKEEEVEVAKVIIVPARICGKG